ncbi:hypothetical protein ACCO45_007049 [Purpureocillium lilacinum]|uniref:Uncharacterized protein n=1 Tax=Purpureocillium lilacinum TaxID=33203 RepID=A0ACC4DS19_PURLI
MRDAKPHADDRNRTLALPRTRTDQDTDGDWQTVTTDQPHEQPREIEIHLIRGTGSSIADVSDTSDLANDGISGTRRRSAQNSDTEWPRPRELSSIRNRRHFMHGREPPDFIWTPNGVRAARPDLSIRVPQMPARAAAAIRGFSSPFGNESSRARRSVRLNAVPESQNLRSSYESLDSEPDDGLMPSARGRHCPKAPDASAGALDSRLLAQGASTALAPELTFGTANDSFYANISRLPFPLVSLPEAAKMQRYRIDRGEEDHTDLPSSFAAKARSTRSGTFSSMSSRTSPLTPLSPFGDLRGSVATSTPARPPIAYQDHFSRRKDTPSFDTTQSRLHSSAILGSSPITPVPRRTSSGPWYEVGLRDSPSILGVDLRRLRGFSLRTRQRRAGAIGESFEMFSRSETELIRSAREEVRLNRAMRGQENDRQRAIFLAVMVLTLILPPIGLLALLGHFDSAISWYTHGEAHCFTKEQRSILKQQLMVEGALYVGLVIALAVYFGRHN